MSDVLSQNEIDDLLSALSTGSVDANELKEEQTKKKVKLYDFRRPNKFSKDQIHTLQVIYENYARSLGTYLSAHLRAPLQMEVLSVEQLTYDEFIRSIPNPTIFSIFSLYPLEGSAILEINPNLGFTFLDRLLGGPGIVPPKIRGLTEIELTVMEKLGQKMLDALQEPWESIIELDPVIERIETNPQFTQLVSPGEIMIIVSIEVKMNDELGMINMCIPFIVLEPIIEKLSVHYYYAQSSNQKKSPENETTIKQKLQNTALPIKVVLGETVITVKDLLELSVGDVVPVNKNIGDEIEVIIGQRTKFLGKPGIHNNKSSIQITKVLEEGNENE
ncbi:Flagellar motor switch protein FliM [Candidatus Syntrophocurvum alkaliphilum]|uniref:Flagellar motor switch protein FliM n=1 Tax=Candidatus Syntrophocurvum alkaliphilum TaxID=2293317 RepID=A0A6I6DD31_9FIRM|nr:flagellar motor switch protein FliM [Candidatus Syntrophocurvum alkaliphilum]QGT99175.1 Flagellar motor switch protein FliM [Candidatus Syntrophocurvum alkaliphilum]